MAAFGKASLSEGRTNDQIEYVPKRYVNPPTIQNANSARASIAAPMAPNTYTLMLTVTDNQGRMDTATVVITSSAVQTTAPVAAGSSACPAAVAYSVPPPNSGAGTSGGGSGHGGGGGLDLLTLMLLAAAALGAATPRRALRQPYSSRCAASSQVRCARR